MHNRRRLFKVISLGIPLLCIIAGLVFLLQVRSQFVRHLALQYPGRSFSVGFAKVDPLYGKFYAAAACRDDGTAFAVIRGFRTPPVYDDYRECRSQNQYNARLQAVFAGSGLAGDIAGVTGGGKTLYDGSDAYEQISFTLAGTADHPRIARAALAALHDAGITADLIVFHYEKDRHVYELHLSSPDYALSETEIASRVKQIK